MDRKPYGCLTCTRSLREDPLSTESLINLLPPRSSEFPSRDDAAILLVAPIECSPWTSSFAKRLFDTAVVCSMLPILLPALLVIALAVRVTSRGPALFLQTRIGRNGRPFAIVKFRTMLSPPRSEPTPGACFDLSGITRLGKLLRNWKLDELPQFLNVLRGDMSLVGPRPKIAEHQVAVLPCRPGITGAATLAFAREELLFAQFPGRDFEAFYRGTVLPIKHRLDVEYMAQSTFRSDLAILLRTALRRWDTQVLFATFPPQALEQACIPPTKQCAL
jgi:lipopolysaccharide/colanic/teichoic acid biosynthesis glycosyltransferase